MKELKLFKDMFRVANLIKAYWYNIKPVMNLVYKKFQFVLGKKIGPLFSALVIWSMNYIALKQMVYNFAVWM